MDTDGTQHSYGLWRCVCWVSYSRHFEKSGLFHLRGPSSERKTSAEEETTNILNVEDHSSSDAASRHRRL